MLIINGNFISFDELNPVSNNLFNILYLSYNCWLYIGYIVYDYITPDYDYITLATINNRYDNKYLVTYRVFAFFWKYFPSLFPDYSTQKIRFFLEFLSTNFGYIFIDWKIYTLYEIVIRIRTLLPNIYQNKNTIITSAFIIQLNQIK